MSVTVAQVEAGYLKALKHRKVHGSFPKDFQELIARYAHPRRREGITWTNIAKELPVSSSTVRIWTRAHPEPPSMVPVVIQPDAPAPRGSLTLVSPGGYRLQGLSLRQAVDLLRRLG